MIINMTGLLFLGNRRLGVLAAAAAAIFCFAQLPGLTLGDALQEAGECPQMVEPEPCKTCDCDSEVAEVLKRCAASIEDVKKQSLADTAAIEASRKADAEKFKKAAAEVKHASVAAEKEKALQIAALKEQLGAAAIDLARKESEAEKLEAKLKSLTKSLEEINERVKSSNSQHGEELAKKESEVAEMEARLQDAETQERKRALELARVEGDLATRDNRVAELEASVAAASSEMDAMKNSLEQTLVQLSITETERAADAKEISALQERVEKETATYEEMVRQLSEELDQAQSESLAAIATRRVRSSIDDVSQISYSFYSGRVAPWVKQVQDNHVKPGVENAMKFANRTKVALKETTATLRDKSAPYVARGSQLYSEHIKPVYEKYVQPTYEKHVRPGVDETRERAAELWEKILFATEKYYQQAIARMEEEPVLRGKSKRIAEVTVGILAFVVAAIMGRFLLKLLACSLQCLCCCCCKSKNRRQRARSRKSSRSNKNGKGRGRGSRRSSGHIARKVKVKKEKI